MQGLSILREQEEEEGEEEQEVEVVVVGEEEQEGLARVARRNSRWWQVWVVVGVEEV